ncbi:MAG: hypothetical protein GY839_21190 [candidate division Zixibacteria bacterium]|nr:hypothetical protein [candidate division Zixibacteria bacterium]
MKRTLICVALLLIVLMVAPSHGQGRLPQFELFVGGAIPLAPDGFKDYYKTGLSIHGQYVIFLSPSIGLSFGAAYEFFMFDSDAFNDDFAEAYGWDPRDFGIDTDGNSGILELGVGVRPYLTPATANSQIFLFGMGTYNALKNEVTVSDGDTEETIEGNESKMGAALGAGIELPAGNMNVIIQGLYRFIFTEGETTSFVGVTGGIVF